MWELEGILAPGRGSSAVKALDRLTEVTPAARPEAFSHPGGDADKNMCEQTPNTPLTLFPWRQNTFRTTTDCSRARTPRKLPHKRQSDSTSFSLCPPPAGRTVPRLNHVRFLCSFQALTHYGRPVHCSDALWHRDKHRGKHQKWRT